ncbi:hypothetical protein [Flavihumibacter sp. CACIAM 22H1]|uniref:tellurite resistance TerB family protein n=1 Tax=Flavihumibacter sp. CACIAM 22H1 TaxID=1812911 RepID=UPI000AC333B2|nr:hypothetical protein [Flavihumibacter sp. CACIAM 22H1]
MTSELHTHFLNLYSMALADSKFDEEEIAILYRLGGERGIPRETIDALLLNPQLSEHVAIPETLIEKIECLYDYARMILADGVVHEDEVKTLEKFCEKFQFQENNIPLITQLLIEAARNGIAKNELVDFVLQNN